MIRFIKKWLSFRANPSSKAESSPADEATTAEQSTDADASTSSESTAKPAIPDAVEVELQRRFNEFERRFNDRQQELLNDRAKSINSWLAVIAIVLTAFGIVIPLGAYIWAIFSFKEFEEIKTQAQSYVKEIEQYRDEARSLTQDINAEIVASDPAKAKQVIEDVRENPKASSTDKAIAKAVSLQDQGKEEEALKIWRGIANAFEEVDRQLAARAYFSVGYLFYLQEKHKDAIAAYDQAMHLDPDNAADYNNRGTAKNAQGRHEDAIADYDEAIRLKPDYDVAYFNRGNAKNAQGHHEAAIADYNQTIRLQPNFVQAYLNRGLAKDEMGRIDEARQDFEKARDLAHKVGNDSLIASAEQELRDLDNRESE